MNAIRSVVHYVRLLQGEPPKVGVVRPGVR
jgi:hypothetical protein